MARQVISPRARRYIQRQATGVMQSVVRIERVFAASDDDYDHVTLQAGQSSRVTLYEGPARLREVTGGATIVLAAETDIKTSQTFLSIPWDYELHEDALVLPPEKRIILADDEFVMIEHNTDSQLVGRRGEITDVAAGGELRATRRFSVTLSQRKSD